MSKNGKQNGETLIVETRKHLARIGIELPEETLFREDELPKLAKFFSQVVEKTKAKKEADSLGFLILRSSLGDVTQKNDSSAMKQLLNRAPGHIVELYENYERVANGLTYTIGEHAQYEVGLEFTPHFCLESKTAKLKTIGKMPMIVKIDHGAASFFIDEIIELQQKLNNNGARMFATQQYMEEKNIKIGNLWESIMEALIVSRPELLMKDGEIRIEQDSNGEFVFTLNGIIQSNIKMDPIKAAGIYKDQIEKDQLEAEMVDHQELIDELKELIEESYAEINQKTTGVLWYFQKNPIPNCSMPIAVAIDSKDDLPCVIVIADIDDTTDEIPKDVLRETILNHLNGERILEEEYQNALGVTEIIKDIQRMFDDL